MIPLTDDFKEERAIGLLHLITNDILDGWGRYSKIRENRELYYGTASAMMPLPWSGASNVHLPLMMEKVETLVPMVMSALWGVDPVVNVERSAEEFNGEQTDVVEQATNFFVQKDIRGLYETTECWFRDMGLDSMGSINIDWEQDRRDVSKRYTLKAMYDLGDKTPLGVDVLEARPKSALELLVDVFGPVDAPSGLIDAVPVGDDSDDTVDELEEEVLGSRWLVRFLEDRRLFTAFVQFVAADHIDEVDVIVRRSIIAHEGVTVDLMEYEDLILPYRAKCIQSASRVTQRYWLTIDELEDKYVSGDWDLTEEDMEMLRAQGTREHDNSHTNPQLQEQKDSHVGEDRGYKVEKVLETPEGYEPYNGNKVMIFRVFLKDMVEIDGIKQEVVYHIPFGLRKIVRADYLEELYPHGRRPFVTAKYIPISNRWAALGLGDQLAQINLEINTIVNYVNNAQELINNPFYFYEPTAMNNDVRGIQGIRPGQGVPVMSTQGILFPKFMQQPLANLETMTSLLMFADRLTISPIHSGSTQMKNAPRTARGTLALLGEGHVQTDMLIRRIQVGPWNEMIEQVFGLYQEFCPDEKWFYITRKDGTRAPHRISRKMLEGRYEFNFKGNTVNTNREVLRQLAQVRYSVGIAHPDAAMDPNFRSELWIDFLKYWGEGADIDRLKPALPGHGAYTHPPMRQQDENVIMATHSMPVPVLPTDDHAAHLQIMEQFERTQQFAQMPAEAVGIYAFHKQSHMALLQQQAAQQTMPVGAGTANNVPLGLGQSDTNVMEGGNVR